MLVDNQQIQTSWLYFVIFHAKHREWVTCLSVLISLLNHAKLQVSLWRLVSSILTPIEIVWDFLMSVCWSRLKYLHIYLMGLPWNYVQQMTDPNNHRHQVLYLRFLDEFDWISMEFGTDIPIQLRMNCNHWGDHLTWSSGTRRWKF